MQLRALVGDKAEIVGPDTPLAEVAKLLFEQEVAAVAVVDRTGLIGICTDRDLAGALSTGADGNAKVSDHMTNSPDVVDPEVSVRGAAGWMLETGYRHLPVMEDGELLGIVDVRDVLWALVPKGE
jgi:CBS domain-containing protein